MYIGHFISIIMHNKQFRKNEMACHKIKRIEEQLKLNKICVCDLRNGIC